MHFSLHSIHSTVQMCIKFFLNLAILNFTHIYCVYAYRKYQTICVKNVMREKTMKQQLKFLTETNYATKQWKNGVLCADFISIFARFWIESRLTVAWENSIPPMEMRINKKQRRAPQNTHAYMHNSYSLAQLVCTKIWTKLHLICVHFDSNLRHIQVLRELDCVIPWSKCVLVS